MTARAERRADKETNFIDVNAVAALSCRARLALPHFPFVFLRLLNEVIANIYNEHR